MKCVSTFPTFSPPRLHLPLVGSDGLASWITLKSIVKKSTRTSTPQKQNTHTQKNPQLPRPQRKQNNSNTQTKLFSKNSYRLPIDRFSPLGFLFSSLSLSLPQKKRSRRLLKCRGARNRRSVVSGRVHAPLRSSELMWGLLVRSQRSCWQSSAVPGHPDTAAPPAGRDARVEERGCEKIK